MDLSTLILSIVIGAAVMGMGLSLGVWPRRGFFSFAGTLLIALGVLLFGGTWPTVLLVTAGLGIGLFPLWRSPSGKARSQEDG